MARAKIEKTPFVVGLWLGLGKIENGIIFGWPYFRVMANIEKGTLCGGPLVMVRAKIEKTPVVLAFG